MKHRASERCHQEKRKTINGEDILFAMQTLGFDNYVEPLKLYLQKYREVSRTFLRFVCCTWQLPIQVNMVLSTDDLIM